VLLQILSSYPKRLGDSSILVLSKRNVTRRFVEVFEGFWFRLHGFKTLRVFILYLIRARWLRNNDSITRNLLTRALPWDPLIDTHGPALDIYCLVAEKDLDLLRFTLPSLLNISSNPIRKTYIVAPESLNAQIKAICQKIAFQYLFISDERLLEIFSLDPKQFKSGHPKMLMLKYLAAIHSDLENVLVVDGDTVFLKPRQWLSTDQKLIVVSQELHLFHLDYCSNFFGIDSRNNLGFTTQSQVLSQADISEIAEHVGGLAALAKNFSEIYENFNSRRDQRYFPAEWQLACGWSNEFNERRTAWGSYSNLGMNREIFFALMKVNGFLNYDDDCSKFLQSIVPNLGSISLHGYK